jgi:hypothetical protein
MASPQLKDSNKPTLVRSGIEELNDLFDNSQQRFCPSRYVPCGVRENGKAFLGDPLFQVCGANQFLM